MAKLNTFAGADLDRTILPRVDDAWVTERLVDPDSRIVLLEGDRVLVREGPSPSLALLAPGETPVAAEPEPVLLGLLEGRALFAARAAGPRPAAPGGGEEHPLAAVGLREAGEMLTQQDGGLAAYAAGLLNWHRGNPFCPVCGTRSLAAAAGHERHCPNCGAVHHPRIDPVVIMLVTDGERILLGRRHASPPERLSVLAGFVEPGESLEEAVVREVLEEASVQVNNVRYVSSQPWPFPGQLMLGFTALHADGKPTVGDRELAQVGWVEREQVALAAQGRGDFVLPGPVAIARRLIDAWLHHGPPARRRASSR